MYNLFKQSPARRADFTVINPNSKFPKKICQTRWIENVDVCERAIEVYNNIREYLAKTKKLPATKTVDTLKTAVKDPLTVPKVMFFSSVASVVEPYLRKISVTKTNDAICVSGIGTSFPFFIFVIFKTGSN